MQRKFSLPKSRHSKFNFWKREKRDNTFLFFPNPRIFHFCWDKCWPLVSLFSFQPHFHTERGRTCLFIGELHFSGFSEGRHREKSPTKNGNRWISRGRCGVRMGLIKAPFGQTARLLTVVAFCSNERSTRQSRAPPSERRIGVVSLSKWLVLGDGVSRFNTKIVLF